MLLDYKIENWKSFRYPALFSAVKSRGRQHIERLPVVQDYPPILPVAAIYGPNGSGKTNWVSSMQFLKDFIVHPKALDEETGVIPYVLCDETKKQPTTFNIRFLADDDVIYDFDLVLNNDQVLHEMLSKWNGGRQELLYEQKLIGTGESVIRFHHNLHDRKKELDEIFGKTFENRTFLTTAALWGNELVRPAFDWFEKNLMLSSELYDTGLVSQSVAEELLRLDVGAFFPKYKEEFALPKSEGAQRLTLLLPSYLKLLKPLSRKVFIVDELDRSLHHNLTKELVENFFSSCSPKSRSQFIFTTQDTLLIDPRLFRVDELWTTNMEYNLNEYKNDNQWSSSRLVSFNDYKQATRDSHLRESYLQGRMTGVPNIAPVFGDPKNVVDIEEGR